MTVAPRVDLGARSLAEGLGTAFLVATVVGSGIAAETRSPQDAGLQLLENSTATALALVALIFCFAPVSGAHLNPAVTVAQRVTRRIDNSTTVAYIGAQVLGGCVGAIVANVMFDLPAVDWSGTDRTGGPLVLAEVIATFGLVLIIFGVVHSGRSGAVPIAVGGYIGAAYWFTSSTSFANPAVTIARTLTDTFSGIAPGSAPAFLAAQLAGALAAAGVARILFPGPALSFEEVPDDRSPRAQLRPATRSRDGGQEPARAVRGHLFDGDDRALPRDQL